MNKKEKYLRKNGGITLIVLVVTIIVLIILAGISINLILGENGIIKKAQKAKEKHEEAVQEEREQLDIAYEQIESLNSDSLAANVKVGDYVNYTPKSGETITIYQGSYNGKTEGTFEDIATINEDGEAIANGEIGSGYNENQIFTVPADTSNIKWRVLNVENGVVSLISEKEIGRTGLWSGSWTIGDSLYLQDIIGYVYGEEVINQVCSIYGTGEGAKGARSITIEDINQLTGYDVTKDSEYNEDYGEIVKLNNYNYRWNWTYYTYEYNKEGMNLKTENEDSMEYKLLFNNEPYYWLASRCVWPTLNDPYFQLRCVDGDCVNINEMFYCDSNGNADYVDYNYPVRPIVTLKSTVKAGTSTTDENGITIWNMDLSEVKQ